MNFEYITSNIPSEGINLNDFVEDLQGCKCTNNQCSSEYDCSCVNLSGNRDNYDLEGRLICSINSNNPIFECSKNCACIKLSCRNRVVQYGIQCEIEVFDTGNKAKGLGVRTLQPILLRKFVAEYTGEIISHDEALSRFQSQQSNNGAQQHNYIFTINEFFCGRFHKTYIDAYKAGNLARFMNHSCEPNLFPQILRIGSVTPRLVLFALRDIAVGEELCYDYGHQFRYDCLDTPLHNLSEKKTETQNEVSKKTCYCGAAKCTKILPYFNDDDL